MVIAAGVGIAIEAVREIITPHHTPAPFTLAVLAGTIVIKESLFRAVRRAARESGSAAVETDAWHHRADAITSAAAFLGISIALIGKMITRDDRRFAPADDWAALFASLIIFYNAAHLIIPPIRELLDARHQPTEDQARATAANVPGVMHVQKVFSRKSGTGYWLDMHVWVDPHMTVQDAHTLAHTIKDAVRANNPRVFDVLIHVEPARSTEISP
jgi:cation diffusion facilitator family transporter